MFAGWGGLQYEDGDADFALVLHPDYWGYGKSIFKVIMQNAFTDLGLDSITILLPYTRTNLKAIFQLGFEYDGDVTYDGVAFQRFRLTSIKFNNNKLFR